MPFAVQTILTSPFLFCVVDGTGLSEHVDLDLAGIFQLVFDLLGNIVREDGELIVGNLFGVDDDADLTACLNGKGLFHAGEGIGDLFQFLQTLPGGPQDRPRPGGSRNGKTARYGKITKKADFLLIRKSAFSVPMSEFLITCVENVMEMGNVLRYNGLVNDKLVQNTDEQGVRSKKRCVRAIS